MASTTSAARELRFPFLDLKAQFSGIRSEILAAVGEVFESQHFILGVQVESLEKQISELVGSKFAIACASGSDALLLAMMAIGIGPGDEVITTPFTFGATAGSIARLQARPVFVDIDSETYNIDPDLIRVAVTSRTKAIMPVHLFGLPAEMQEIRVIADEHDLYVIEDAAQAIKATYGMRNVGNLGHIGCFSFFPSKNLGCAGDGGMLTTSDPSLADRLRLLHVHGSRERYQYECVGMNSRLDAMQAAILRVKLNHLGSWTALRQRNADRYRTLFLDMDLDRHVRLPIEPKHRTHVYNQFVIRAPKRDQLRQELRRAGIPTEIYYPSALHLQPAFKYLGYRAGDFARSESACREVLALPIYPELTIDQQTAVVKEIADFYKRQDS